MRRLITDSIRTDPEWNNGNYAAQPRSARIASVFYGIATAGGTLAYQKIAPTREAADKLVDARLAAPFTTDTNDVLYMWDASRDYDPSPGLEHIKAAVLAINSADDEHCPPSQIHSCPSRGAEKCCEGDALGSTEVDAKKIANGINNDNSNCAVD